MTCYRCLSVGAFERRYNPNAKIWYRGCARCGCGVFFGGAAQ